MIELTLEEMDFLQQVCAQYEIGRKPVGGQTGQAPRDTGGLRHRPGPGATLLSAVDTVVNHLAGGVEARAALYELLEQDEEGARGGN